MKKLINLIALVMLVSTNVLTPFSYAEVEIPEVIPESEVETVTEDTGESGKILENNEETPEINEKTPETNPEEKGELEQGKQEETSEDALPDVQDDEETSVTEETEKVDTVSNEGDEIVQSMEEISEVEVQDENLEGGEAEDDFSLQKVDEFITMEVIPNTSVTLLPGTGFNETIKRLAGGNGATYISGNSTITQIVQTGNIPEGVITGEISEPDSEYPVYAYFTGGILYYTTQAETIYMNPDSSFMFARMSGITRLNLNNLNTENVINMSFMFRSNDVINVDISEWDVSSVTTMESMFNGCSSLTGLDLSNWDTSSLTKIPLLFWGCNSLEYVDLSNWTTSNLTQMNNAFTNCNNLIYLNMSGWDFRSMNSMNNWINYLNLWYPLEKLDLTNAKFSGDLSYMFDGSKAKKIILDGVETKDVTNMKLMFYRCSNLTGLDLSSFDTSNVTNMENMFNGCSNLTWLDLSNFDTSKVTNMDYIFSWCPSLEELNLSGWDFRNVVVSFFRMAGSSPLKKLNMTNTKYTGSLYNAFGSLLKLEEIKLDGVDTRGVTNMSNMFNACSSLAELDLSSFDTSNVTDMGSMFNGCSSLTGLDLSNFDTSNVTNMQAMFQSCNKLETLNMSGWDFSKAMTSDYYYNSPFQNNSGIKRLNLTNAKFGQSMYYMFGSMSKLEELILKGSDTSNVTNMYEAFYDCSSLTGLDLSNWDTSNVTNMSNMFSNCSNLTGLDLSNWDTSNVTNMGSMFDGCSKLEELNLSGWDFRKYNMRGTSMMMSITDGGLPSLTKLNMTNTKYTGDINYAFGGLNKLEELNLDGVDTRGVTSMSAMFGGDANLTELDLSNFDTSNVTDMRNMFQSCNKLENLNLSGWDFRNISNSSLMTNLRSSYNSNNNYPSLKKLNLSNTKYTGDASYAFGGLNKLEYLNLNGADTSNVVNMNSMFSGCSSLTGLDLGGLNTEKVMTMEKMFNGCSKLENLNLDNRIINNSSSTIWGMFGGASNLKNVSMRNWTIPETFTHAIGCRTSSLCSTSLESIDVSNWDLSKTKDLNGLFGDSKVKEIKGLDTWDTSGVTNMSQMFQGCSSLTGLDLSSFDTSKVTSMSNMFYGCSNLTGLDLSSFDTSNVTNMSVMFNGCSSLTGLDLSNFDTSNVSANNMQAMFGGCSKLENLNLDNWVITGSSSTIGGMFGGASNLKNVSMRNWVIPEAFTHAIGCRTSSLCSTSLESIDVSNWDLSKTKDLNGLFGDSKVKEIKGLDTWDTSGVTNMSQMFYGCSSLDELDLSNFNTSKVEIMGQMFYNTPNLKTIYASNKFVTTALSGDNSSKDMFSGTISVVGGNGTKFDSNYIDKIYAKIDKVRQTGYFTDKNAINVKFINLLDGTETTSTFAKGQKLTPPYVDKYHVVGGYLDEAMTQPIDLKKGVDVYSVIYVKYERNGSSGGGGGGGSSKDTDKDTHGSAEDSQKNTQDDKNTENVIQSETKGSEESSNTPIDSSDKSSEGQEILSPSDSPSSAGQVSFTKEQKDAYTFAKQNGITTKDTIQSAQMNGKLTRIAMAKMLSQYAINVLGQTPDTSKTIKFRDVTSKKDADYDNGVTLAYQLGIMGQNMPNNRFRPNDEVSRAEFVTALSRLLYQTTDGEYKSTSKYYTPHMAKLYNEGIINNTDPSMKERRGYVMIMLMRSVK